MATALDALKQAQPQTLQLLQEWRWESEKSHMEADYARAELQAEQLRGNLLADAVRRLQDDYQVLSERHHRACGRLPQLLALVALLSGMLGGLAVWVLLIRGG